MVRIGALFLSVSCVATALAQTPAGSTNAPSPATTARIAPGSFAGKLQEEKGKMSSDVKLTIKDVTKDGRVTARMQATHARAACAANLPANGLVLPDGTVRLEVNDGVPEGCERIYNLKFAGASVSGTFVGGPGAMKGRGAPKR
jgi:hypothetical protein